MFHFIQCIATWAVGGIGSVLSVCFCSSFKLLVGVLRARHAAGCVNVYMYSFGFNSNLNSSLNVVGVYCSPLN